MFEPVPYGDPSHPKLPGFFSELGFHAALAHPPKPTMPPFHNDTVPKPWVYLFWGGGAHSSCVPAPLG